MQGYNLEDVARGIDETMIRQPLGVVAAITPFNFPGMIPFWFLPYAVATGNTFILKPSERVPLTMRFAFELLERAGISERRVESRERRQSGRRRSARSSQDSRHQLRGLNARRQICLRASGGQRKRAQCQGGAKNPVIVLPDADMESATQIISDSAFGCAGQRCLAVSVAVAIGDAQKTFRDAIADSASKLRVGDGLDQNVQMGPVITPQSKSRIEELDRRAARKKARKCWSMAATRKFPAARRGNFITADDSGRAAVDERIGRIRRSSGRC